MKLLIVDDVESNRKILRVTFQAAGHTTLEAADGVEALQVLDREKVDAVLSDILMPRMDGYRLCHEIRSSERLHELPFVMYTSTYTLPGDEKLCLSVGADAYLRKPAPFQTILAALEQAIAIPHGLPQPEAWKEVEVLKEYSDRLVGKLEHRNIALAEANERLTILDRAKNDFLRVIAHELRTPLVGLFGVGEIILGAMPENDANGGLRRIYQTSRERLLSILDDALLLTEIDVNGGQFLSAPVALSAAVAGAIRGATSFAESRHVKFATSSFKPGLVWADKHLLERALRSLLETAVKFSLPHGVVDVAGAVDVACEVAADRTVLIIDSRGPLVSAAAAAKFFAVFSIAEPLTKGGDLGLGAAVAHRILELFGASVTVANRESSGLRISISLKTAAASSQSTPAAA